MKLEFIRNSEDILFVLVTTSNIQKLQRDKVAVKNSSAAGLFTVTEALEISAASY